MQQKNCYYNKNWKLRRERINYLAPIFSYTCIWCMTFILMCIYRAIICINMLEKYTIFLSLVVVQVLFLFENIFSASVCMRASERERMIISYEDDCLMSPVAVGSLLLFSPLFCLSHSLAAATFCAVIIESVLPRCCLSAIINRERVREIFS